MNWSWFAALIIMIMSIVIMLPIIQNTQEAGSSQIINGNLGKYTQLKQICMQWETYYANCGESGDPCCEDQCMKPFKSSVFGYYKVAILAKTSGIAESELCVGDCPLAKTCANEGFRYLVGVPDGKNVEDMSQHDVNLYATQESSHISDNFNDLKKNSDKLEEIANSCITVCQVVLERAETCKQGASVCAASSSRLS